MIILRPFELKDLYYLHDLLSNEKVNKYLPWFVFQTVEQTRNHLEQFYLKASDQKSKYRFAICSQENDEMLGYIHLNLENKANDLGYALREKFHNQGIITSACKMFLEYLKKEGEIDYITATHDVNNIASGRVMQKIGMTYQYSYYEFWTPKNIEVVFRMYQFNFKEGQKIYEVYKEKHKHFYENLKV
ncbi:MULTISPECIES: GNAT family N-acetyltransferase [Campylobacter]|uniref:GNAT family N-acetyltransferase n=1 Tax=Campylobacter taeniopygiae TaxID=2510188 RepID=A0ABY2TIH3_9BACT|nr:GNAT family N-acetyltransferase [Campylobacter taeniopygiae]MBZ7935481.1 GNAT family N-acetyltransferase [Campylobacter sp. B0100352/1]MBZ7963855.1 GNAT family N-acetyltransferase [Campylobacter sp. 2457A]TKX33858.1 GNAT family N-acetyltransferase [Campylobacter taeniopygiae]